MRNAVPFGRVRIAAGYGGQRCCSVVALVTATVTLALTVLYFVYDVNLSLTPRRNLLEREQYHTREESTSQSKSVDTNHGFEFLYTTIGLDPRLATPPGDMGRPVTVNLTSEQVAALTQQGIQTQGFNQYFSDLMSVRRRLPEIRDPWCAKPGRFLADLPATSIVIVFFNEAWSVVLRTVHSVLDRSPAHLVREIVLVDDCSTLGEDGLNIFMLYKVQSKSSLISASKSQNPTGRIFSTISKGAHPSSPGTVGINTGTDVRCQKHDCRCYHLSGCTRRVYAR